MTDEKQTKQANSTKTIFFIVVLSFICALILSVLASALSEPKTIAKELDRSKQMMIAAKILSHDGHLLVNDKEGKTVPARLENHALVPDPNAPLAASNELLEVYNTRFTPMLVNDKGEIKSFKDLKINEEKYLSDYRKTGYYKESWKLIYVINPDPSQKEKKPEGYVLPINGSGLWDAIFGYLAIKTDGNTVIGTSWYDQKETPGLGANIAEAYWQNLFPGKKVFQESPDGETDVKSAPLGITVVKGKVSEVLGDSPRAKSAVDGMTGATLTGNGVTDAYKDVLAGYRPFLMKLYLEKEKG